ncbi:histone acetyltransferase YNG2 SCDLUD_004686 [Saccharomycodes ludwigii]|uniref:histone acetyltransferase YNG2 n=1 Tax=Saccharomycodes ludwigii TaxID=36035 RepID=UPI001E83BC75|nr:hypothetical protein SCDLUD_004686 [Saccharomycodes ludwigii]KAH3899252.1 hypothetical protein SCDLUD_004686 [Saccharomycodes ludwigii]
MNDPSTLLEQTVSDISNLEEEFKFILNELRYKDKEILALRNNIESKDLVLQKHVKQKDNNSTTGMAVSSPHPNELQLNKEIEEEYKRCLKLQERKNILSNTLLYLVSEHLSTLQKGMEILSSDGLLAEPEFSIKEEEEKELAATALLAKRNGVMDTEDEMDSRYRQNLLNGRSNSGKAYSDYSDYDETDITTSRKRGSLKKQVKGDRKKHKKNTSTSLMSQQQRPSGTSSLAKKIKSNGNATTLLLDDALFAGGSGTTGINGRDEEDDDKKLYCFCQNVSYGEMVACDGEHCKYEWFHYGCVNLTEPPKGKWYCPECKQEALNKKRKS